MLPLNAGSKVSFSSGRLSPRLDSRYDHLQWVDAGLIAPASAIALTDVLPDARKFMEDAGLIRPGEEQLPDPNDPKAFMRTAWAPIQVVKFGEKDLIVMDLRLEVNDGAGHWVGGSGCAREVIAVEKTAQGIVFKKFEDVFPIPETLTVGIGQGWVTPGQSEPPAALYYVELSGPDVLAALKDIYTKNHYSGFSGQLVPGGKAPFDPTPGRTWQIRDPKFDLRRGRSVEISDVYPSQLDGDFQAYFEGSNGQVAPWNGHIRKVLVDGVWRDTMPDEGLGTPGAMFSVSDAFIQTDAKAKTSRPSLF